MMMMNNLFLFLFSIVIAFSECHCHINFIISYFNEGKKINDIPDSECPNYFVVIEIKFSYVCNKTDYYYKL